MFIHLVYKHATNNSYSDHVFMGKPVLVENLVLKNILTNMTSAALCGKQNLSSTLLHSCYTKWILWIHDFTATNC